MTLLPYALDAVHKGFYIFPCNPCGTLCPETGKPIDKQGHLITPGKPYKIKWADVATNDVNKVIEWWSYSPWANIGIAVKPSNLLVVDCDEGEGKHGIDQWADLCVKMAGKSNACLGFATYTVRTGSGGLHFYFRWPPGVQASQRALDTAVDVRSNGGERGGYVLGPGSRTVKGEYAVDQDMPVLSAMRWLQALCTLRQPPKPIRGPFDQPAATGDYSGLQTSVRLADEGNRNQTLVWAACAMAEDGAPLARAIELLGEASALPRREAETTIRSGYRMKGKA